MGWATFETLKYLQLRPDTGRSRIKEKHKKKKKLLMFIFFRSVATVHMLGPGCSTVRGLPSSLQAGSLLPIHIGFMPGTIAHGPVTAAGAPT